MHIVILAAGRGKRMFSDLPKVLQPLAGKPLLAHVLKTALSLSPKALHVVYGYGGEQVKAAFPDYAINWVQQEIPQGTGHAVKLAIDSIPNDDEVLILYGDVPLVSSNILADLAAMHTPGAVSLLSMNVGNPSGYGRILRDAESNQFVLGIVEEADANEQQILINEVNSGILLATSGDLRNWLNQVNNDNAQQEFYLTDIVELASEDKRKVRALCTNDESQLRGVNNLYELSQAERQFQRKIAKELMLAGVRIVDVDRIDIRGDVRIAAGVSIEIGVILEGDVVIEKGVSIGAYTHIKNSTVGENVTIKSHSVIEGARIKQEVQVGPFARLRPGSELHPKSRVGNFVEIKNTVLGKNSKANHLTYLGDSVIGVDSNIGAGCVTCNYDGINKHQTVIGDNAFIGSGVMMIAPITIEDNALIAAGSTVNKRAPSDHLTIARSKQVALRKPPMRKK